MDAGTLYDIEGNFTNLRRNFIGLHHYRDVREGRDSVGLFIFMAQLSAKEGKRE